MKTWLRSEEAEKLAIVLGLGGLLFVFAFIILHELTRETASAGSPNVEYVSDDITVHTVTLPDGTTVYCIRTTYGSNQYGSVGMECVDR